MEQNNISISTNPGPMASPDLLRRAMEEVDRDYTERKQTTEQSTPKSLLQKELTFGNPPALVSPRLALRPRTLSSGSLRNMRSQTYAEA